MVSNRLCIIVLLLPFINAENIDYLITKRNNCIENYVVNNYLQSSQLCHLNKSVTEVHLEDHMQVTTEEISPQLQRFMENILISPTTEEDGLCGKQSTVVHVAAKKLELWALKMLDSSSKLSSGLFSGNFNDLGDFDQCLSVNHNHITGQYCLALLEIRPTNNTGRKLQRIFEIAKSNEAIKFSTPGTLYTSHKFATCVPASCSPSQIQTGLMSTFRNYIDLPEVELRWRIDPQLCYKNEDQEYDIMTNLVWLIFATILCLTLIATLIDTPELAVVENKFIRIVLAFSLRRTWNQLLSTKVPSDDISSLHGVRALNAYGLLICHKALVLMLEPVFNKTVLVEQLSKSWTIAGRVGIQYTDTFILMSGLLNAYALIPELDRKKGKIDLWSKYVNRFIRITPNLLGITLFCTYIIPISNSGPIWNEFITSYSDTCKKYMWRNFLYIQNYYGIEEMCLPFTHQLATDMQLYIISPFLVYIIWKWPRSGTLFLFALAGLSTILRYAVAIAHKLTFVVYFGVPIERLIATSELSYMLPTHRLTAFVIGILLGNFLRKRPKGLELTKTQAKLTWILVTILTFGPLYHIHTGSNRGFEFNYSKMAVYSSIFPIFWSIVASGWIILCLEDRGGFLGRFFRWKGFIIFSRISYAFYLTQFPVIMYNIAKRRDAGFTSISDLFYIPEYLTILSASVILTLLIDMPFQQVKKIMSEKSVPVIKTVPMDPKIQ